MKKYLAEAFGTFTLTLVVALSFAGSFPISTPILAVLTVGLFVYAVGHISGSHVNPAVTLGLWSIKKISSADTIKYIIAQFLGAGIALYLFSLVSDTENSLAVINSFEIGLAEFMGMFFYAFFLGAFVYGRTPSEFSGFIVAGSLLLGIAVSSFLGSNGIINPAVALGIGSFNLMYLVAPLLGSILGMQTYKYFLEQ